MLGWCILKEGEYKLKLPRLSEDEERAIVSIEQEFKERRNKKQRKRQNCAIAVLDRTTL
jgi:hypothetical protein